MALIYCHFDFLLRLLSQPEYFCFDKAEGLISNTEWWGWNKNNSQVLSSDIYFSVKVSFARKTTISYLVTENSYRWLFQDDYSSYYIFLRWFFIESPISSAVVQRLLTRNSEKLRFIFHVYFRKFPTLVFHTFPDLLSEIFVIFKKIYFLTESGKSHKKSRQVPEYDFIIVRVSVCCQQYRVKEEISALQYTLWSRPVKQEYFSPSSAWQVL